MEIIERIIMQANKGQFDISELEAIQAECPLKLKLMLNEVAESFDDFEFQRGIDMLLNIQASISN